MKSLSSKVEVYSTVKKNSQHWPNKISVQEIIMGILIMFIGVFIVFLCEDMANTAFGITSEAEKFKLSKTVKTIGWIIICGGLVLLLIGIFYLAFAKREIKRQTGASQIAEGSDGELIEVYEEDPRKRKVK